MGTSSPRAPTIGVITDGPAARVVSRVISAQAGPAHPAILNGALDAPLPGTVWPGLGVELNGWVMPTPGNELRGVFTVVEGIHGPLQPLNVARPDVVADYPTASSSPCGFSLWCPLPGSGAARIQLVSVVSTGDLVPLLDLHVDLNHESPGDDPDMRAVNGPDFVIIGTQRGGTTSLHAYLNTHPDIQTPAKKEIHYLTDRFERGAEWYIGQFPATVPVGTLVGEATPYAIFHPLAPERLRDVAPTSKVIVLLRNPVDRAYSHYLHERARGHELLSFEDAIAAEPERLRGLAGMLTSGELNASDAHKRFSYLARGRYAPQLERWLSVFPRQQTLILRSDDLYADPASATRQVTDFLGLVPLAKRAFTAHNATAGPPMRSGTRERLTREFADDNVQLTKLLGWNPRWS